MKWFAMSDVTFSSAKEKSTKYTIEIPDLLTQNLYAGQFCCMKNVVKKNK